jgi:hypothetical protein
MVMVEEIVVLKMREFDYLHLISPPPNLPESGLFWPPKADS